MTLASGTRLGPYEILAPVGAGGMGEVYKARDTRLERTVAVKVLPPHFAETAEMQQRFEREARTTSQLSHPHICALYDVGSHEGVSYLVMEYLEGETLSDLLARGPLSVEQVFRCGSEIADALAAAHRAGVVHRDLKPGNVMLTKTGVKLLDFGLAKVAAPGSGAVTGLSMLPTTPKGTALTEAGTLLGTFQYMAPEQLEGKEADSRSDIFALGAVLYEMATGQKAFEGRNRASLISAILRDEPAPISAVQPLVPAALERVVKICLAKDPEERWQSAQDVRLELRRAADQSEAAAAQAPSASRAAWRRIGEGALLGAIAMALVASLLRRGDTKFPRVELSVVLPQDLTLGDSVSVSPDGRCLAFAASTGGRTLLYVRPLESPDVRALAGTEGGLYPFWSPDGKSIGFFTETALKRVEVSGGSPQTIADVDGPRGGSWNSDGVIVFAPHATSGLEQVRASGGKPSPVTTLDAARGILSHRWPRFLPDGKHFVFFAYGRGREGRGLYLGSLGGEPVRFLEASDRAAFVVRPGFLLFGRADSIAAQPFDLDRLAPGGDPVTIADGVWREIDKIGHTSFSVSEAGVIAFRRGSLASRMSWFDRQGRALGAPGPEGYFDEFSLSPDEKHVISDGALSGEGEGDQLFMLDLERQTSQLVSDAKATLATPLFSPDGSRYAYRETLGSGSALVLAHVDGGAPEVILRSDGFVDPRDWMPDGSAILVSQSNRPGLQLLQLGGTHKVEALLPAATGARFSPDGRYLLCRSAESGRSQVYLQRFPPTSEKWPVSTAGGDNPAWRRDGRELFYIAADGRLMAVPIRLEAVPEIGAPVPLFAPRAVPRPDARSIYAVSRDGQRFLVRTPLESPGGPFAAVILNWSAKTQL